MKAKIEELTAMGEMRFCDGATDDQITKFERDHACALPLEFKEWLRCSDGGELFLPAGIQLYGVGHEPTIDAQDGKRIIIIGALSDGDPILCESGNSKIAIFNVEAGEILDDEIYDNFYAFLEDLPNLLGIEE